MNAIYEFFAQFPDWLATFLLAMSPIGELRASIPFAIGFFKMPAILAFAISIVGNIIPAIIIVKFMKPTIERLSLRSEIIKKLLHWWFAHVSNKFESKYSKYGAWGLLIFVAIPLPGTGAWTGAVVAFLFNIPWKKAVCSIFGGVVIAGIIVTLAASGVIALF